MDPVQILDITIWKAEMKQRAKLLKATNAYKLELQTLYSEWAKEFLNRILGLSFGARLGFISQAVEVLSQQLKERQRVRGMEAFTLGLQELSPSLSSFNDLSEFLQDRELYIDNVLIPELEEFYLENLEAPDFPEKVVQKKSRIGLYAGAFWAITQLAPLWSGDEYELCVWISRDDGATCGQCHNMHLKTFRLDELPVTPGVDVECNGNCRCYLILEGMSDRWPYQGEIVRG